jgi:PAS domain S-box-containing protein
MLAVPECTAETADVRQTEALLKTGALQRAIFNSANFSSIATDAKGVIQIFNVGAERMLGYAAADVVNKITPADISDPHEVVARAKALSAELGATIMPGFEALVFKAARAIEDIYELTYIRKDGSRFPAVVSVTALRDAQDTIIGYLLIGTDNTARKQAEEALLKAGALQGAIFNSANFSSIATDAKGVIQIFNVGAERMLGYAAADVVNKITPADISDPHEVVARAKALSVELGTTITPGFEALVFKAARAIEDIYELTYIRKDGSRFPAVVSVTALRDAQDAIIGYLLIGTDNTARKQIEEERTKLDQRLREREADEQRFRLAAIVDSSNDAIIGKTLDGVITSWNEGARRIFGYSAEEIVGQPVLRLVPASLAHEEPEILAKLARGERVETFDTVRLPKNGHQIHVSVTISPVHDSSGNLVGASKIVRDITDRRLAEDALARARETADAASRELEAFSYAVAHDLRAPLRGMNGFAQVLLDTYHDKLDAEGQDWLQEIVLNARKMGALIDALLSLARLTRSEPRNESVDLSSLVRASAKQLSAAEPGRTVELVVQDHLTADLDPVLARALIENLLGNAWKFTSKVPRARIEFGMNQQKNGTPAFFVRDNGAGFDMAFAGKLFGPFQRLHAADEFPGTGIGLATVQRIARRRGGRAWAEGVVNGGATFHFCFSDRTLGATR